MEGADPRTDGELLVATATDPEAFGTFGRRHVRGVLAFSGAGAPAPRCRSISPPRRSRPRWRRPRATSCAPEPARNWLYGIAWNKLRGAQRRGRADDAVRRGLGMAPIVLTDEAIERIERLAGSPALELMKALPAPRRDAVKARSDRHSRARLVSAARRPR